MIAVDQDDVKAAEHRLQQSGWAAPLPPGGLTDEERVVKRRLIDIDGVQKAKPRSQGFGTLDAKVRSAGMWLAAHLDEAERPLRPFLSTKFSMSFDDAGRAVAEAERLLGRDSL